MPSLRAALLRCLPAAAAPDDVLLGAYAAGDPDAFRALVARHGPLVLGVCWRVLGDAHAAEDAFQATFLVLARQASRLPPTRSLAAWLFGIARRVALKARTADRRRRRREAARRPPVPAEPLSELTARELFAALDEELERLPEAYRLPLLLVYWQGLTQSEAAHRLGCSLGSIKGRLERGRARLAERLRRRGFGPGDLPALLLATVGAAAVPSDLLARTTALAAAPWSRTIPAAVLAFTAAAAPSKVLPAVALAVVLAGVGVLGLALTASPGGPPVVDAPGSPQPAGPRVDRSGDPLPSGAVLRLGTLRYRTDAPITHLSIRPDGRAAFCHGSAVAIMDLDTGQIVRRISGGTRPVDGLVVPVSLTALAFAPDGRTFAAGTVGRRDVERPAPFWLFDAATGARLREFASFHERVEVLAFLADGRQIASFGEDGLVRIWDVATEAKLRELQGPDRKLTSFAASLDGRTLAAGAEARDGTAAVYLWDAASGKLLRTLVGHAADVQAVAFAPDGRTLASGGNATVRLWDVVTGRELRQLSGHAKEGHDKSPYSIRSLAFSPDGRTVASASTDRSARVWSVATGQALDDVAGVSPHALTFRDDRTLLTVYDGIRQHGGWQTLLLRDVAAHAFTNRDVGARHGIGFVGYAPDGQTIATTDVIGATHAWSAADGRNLSARHWSPLSALTLVSPDGRLAAFTEMNGDEDVACVGDVATGQVVRRLPEGGQMGLAFSSDGRWLVTSLARPPKSPDVPTLLVWDTSTGAKRGQIPVREPLLSATALAPDGRSVFTGEGREPPYRLRQWDVASGRPVREFALPQNQGARVLAVSRGGRRLAIYGTDHTIRLWDVATGQECWQVKVPVLFSEEMAFSPDGSLLAVAGEGVRLWDTRTGQFLATVRGDQHGLAFSPDSRRLVTNCGDGTALVWDVEAVTGRRLGGPLDDARQTQLWDDLAGDAALAAHAIDCWQAAPETAIAFLRRKLTPVAIVPPERVAPLAAALDSPTFATRERASKELTALGPGAEAPLREVLAKQSSAEARQRIEAVLAVWDNEQRRAGRALEVLEAIATADARKLLEELARGDPAARLTREAKTSLERLRERR